MKNSIDLNERLAERLVKKYGVSKRFINMSVSGDRVSETSESIKKDVRKITTKLDQELNNL